MSDVNKQNPAVHGGSINQNPENNSQNSPREDEDQKSPAFSLYVRDFLGSFRVSKLHSKSRSKHGSNLSARCFNAYVFLLFQSWIQEPRATLPDNDEDLSELARVSMEEWLDMRPLVMDMFKRHSNDRVYNTRLMKESNKQHVRSEVAAMRKAYGSLGGAKTQANRAAKTMSLLEDENANANGSQVYPLNGAVTAEMIFAAYPKKMSRTDALAAIEAAMITTAGTEILRKTILYAKSREGRDRKYTCGTVTFYKGQRYLEDPAIWDDID